MKSTFIYFLIVFLFVFISFADGQSTKHSPTSQSNGLAAPWTVALENFHKVFIENKGQFDNKNNQAKTHIQYGVECNGVDIYFFNSGVTFRHNAKFKLTEREKEKLEKEERHKNSKPEKEKEEREKYKIVPEFLNMQWLGCNPNAELVAEEQVSNYFTYSNNIKAKAFKKIVYKNIYPNIDIEYIFPENKSGIKYSFILNPGANPNLIKMLYTDPKKLAIDENQNLIITSDFGNFIDHAPNTYFKDGGKIGSNFQLNYNTVSFKLNIPLTNNNQQQTTNSTIIIDPWVITPTLPSVNKAFEIGKDSLDNVYIMGGTTDASLQKYDPTGTLLWTYSTGFNGYDRYGDMTVSPHGISYISWQGELKKINTQGIEIWSYNTFDIIISENWRCAYNCDYSKLLIAAASGSTWAYIIDVANNNVDTLTSTFPSGDEIRTLVKGVNGNFYGLTYGLVPQQIALSRTFVPIYSVPSGQNFTYSGTQYNMWGGQNAIAANGNYIYSTDGLKLFKRDLVTGTMIDSTVIPNGITEHNSGIDVDDCGNIYCSSQGGVYKFNASLNVLGSAATPGQVYDLTLGTNGEIYACGDGFLTSLNLASCPVLTCACIIAKTTNTDFTCGSQGTATVNLSGMGPFTYLWSNGQTTATATGLSAGTYTVTVTSGTECVSTSEVTIINNTGSIHAAAGNNITITPGTTTTLMASGAVNGGTYSWSPVQGLSCTTCANPIASPLSTTDYCVTITDTNGCSDSACVRITVEFYCPTNDGFTVPNAFSPNNDGRSDVFKLEGWGNCVTQFSIIIYDRWGEKVYESNDVSQGWDGRYHGKLLDPAVFVYYIKATSVNADKIIKQGNISLAR